MRKRRKSSFTKGQELLPTLIFTERKKFKYISYDMNKSKKNEAYEILSQRLLELEKKIVVTRNKLKMARLDGDQKENADWNILDEELEGLQAQYFFLENKLFLVKNKTESKTLITYRLLANGEQKEVELTEEGVADPNQGRVSVTSPLGLALVNKKEGEISEVRAKESPYKIQIISIK